MGLDSLGVTELFDALQLYFGVELPLPFVFNNFTISDMLNHLIGLLVPESQAGHSADSEEA